MEAMKLGPYAFEIGARVTKTKGSSWTGRVVGFYETSLTPIGYCVESENEPGSVQIYPQSALRLAAAPEGAGEAGPVAIYKQAFGEYLDKVARQVITSPTPNVGLHATEYALSVVYGSLQSRNQELVAEVERLNAECQQMMLDLCREKGARSAAEAQAASLKQQLDEATREGMKRAAEIARKHFDLRHTDKARFAGAAIAAAILAEGDDARRALEATTPTNGGSGA